MSIGAWRLLYWRCFAFSCNTLLSPRWHLSPRRCTENPANYSPQQKSKLHVRVDARGWILRDQSQPLITHARRPQKALHLHWLIYLVCRPSFCDVTQAGWVWHAGQLSADVSWLADAATERQLHREKEKKGAPSCEVIEGTAETERHNTRWTRWSGSCLACGQSSFIQLAESKKPASDFISFCIYRGVFFVFYNLYRIKKTKTYGAVFLY